MTGLPVRGSLAFAARAGVIFSSGLIQIQVSLNDPLSSDAITIVIGLRFGTGSRFWLNTVSEGDVAIFRPRDELDAFYTLVRFISPQHSAQIASRRKRHAKDFSWTAE
jgi:hypothetical protein